MKRHLSDLCCLFMHLSSQVCCASSRCALCIIASVEMQEFQLQNTALEEQKDMTARGSSYSPPHTHTLLYNIQSHSYTQLGDVKKKTTTDLH